MEEKRQLFYVEAIREAVEFEMRRDPKIFVAGEDAVFGGNYGEWIGLNDKFPGRCRSTPISETAIVGLGVGSAAMGLRPICAMSKVDFMMVAMDEIVNQVSKFRHMYGGNVKLPMVLQCAYGISRGAAAQHSQSLEALFCHLPGIKVVVPSTPGDAKGLFAASIRDDNPVIFMQSLRLLGTKGYAPEGEYVIPLGTCDVKKTGSDITIISWGNVLLQSLLAAEELEKDGIHAEVVDVRTLVPLDLDTILKSVEKTGRVLIAHEDTLQNGYGAEIAAQIMDKGFDLLDAPVKRLGAPNCPVPFSPVLEAAYLVDKPKIMAAVKEILG